MVKGATKIYPSPKKFDVSELEFQSTEATQITLSQALAACTRQFTTIPTPTKLHSNKQTIVDYLYNNTYSLTLLAKLYYIVHIDLSNQILSYITVRA